MRTSSNDIRRGIMGTHHPSKEQAHNRTDKDGKEYIKMYIRRQKNKRLGKRKDKRYRRGKTNQKTEVDMGRARQQDTR